MKELSKYFAEDVVEGVACDADAGAANIIATKYPWINTFLDPGHFKTNHAKALGKVFRTRVDYIGLAKRMARWFMRILKRAAEEAARTSPDLSAAEQRAAILTIFNNLYQHTWRHYSDAPCHANCPCKQYEDVDDARHASAECAVEDEDDAEDARFFRERYRHVTEVEDEWAAEKAIDDIFDAFVPVVSADTAAKLQPGDGPAARASDDSCGQRRTTGASGAQVSSTSTRKGPPGAGKAKPRAARVPRQTKDTSAQKAATAKPPTKSKETTGGAAAGLKKWTPCPEKVGSSWPPQSCSWRTFCRKHASGVTHARTPNYTLLATHTRSHTQRAHYPNTRLIARPGETQRLAEKPP